MLAVRLLADYCEELKLMTLLFLVSTPSSQEIIGGLSQPGNSENRNKFFPLQCHYC